MEKKRTQNRKTILKKKTNIEDHPPNFKAGSKAIIAKILRYW